MRAAIDALLVGRRWHPKDGTLSGCGRSVIQPQTLREKGQRLLFITARLEHENELKFTNTPCS